MLQLLSFDESDFIDDDYDDDGYDSGSAGTCNLPFRFEYSVGHVDDSVGRFDDSVGSVLGMGSGIFFQ